MAAGHTCPRFEAALAIHLFKGGTLLLGQIVPFGVVFGGTDVNEDVKDEHKRAVMEEVLRKARFAVAFTDKLKERAEVLLVRNVRVYSSGFLQLLLLTCQSKLSAKVENLCVFLLVCGLRRVKDPLYLLEAFAEWHSQNPLVVLIIIVYLAADLSQEELHAGMSAAILEAMDLGLPVLARDVTGNAEFNEFVSLSRKLLDDRRLQERLVRNGKNYITACQNPMKERITYQKLVETLH
uniref:Glycosyltransferase 1 domain containing 1 n=1 Tax=Cyprinus carpio TaxID=7962 RepID=A0A8C1ZSR5_CYPCA